MTHRVTTEVLSCLSDLVTPVNMYLRVRDRFPETLLLESADYRGSENSFSYLCVKPLATIRGELTEVVELGPGERSERRELTAPAELLNALDSFCAGFVFDSQPTGIVNGFFGFCSYDAVQSFEDIRFRERPFPRYEVPLLHYSLFEFVVAIDHFRNTMYLLHNRIEGIPSTDPYEFRDSLFKGEPVSYPFATMGSAEEVISDDQHKEIIEACKRHIRRGDVFQIVPSRRFLQRYSGDDFQVYRAIRSINPSPFLFFFDYGTYRIFGSSPEYQILVKEGRAAIFPIAGTLPRNLTGETDQQLAERLQGDPKETAEHVMLVDLARNDLSRHCTDVRVDVLGEVQFYSHVVHLVSKVSGTLNKGHSPLQVLADTFPAGTLSGAPKYRAMELIDRYEPHERGVYGGAIGVIGTRGECVHAIMIRTFLSTDNTLHYQAGGGIVADSVPDAEVQEVRSKVGALTRAIAVAEEMSS
jgi:anthranilate synthase component 1